MARYGMATSTYVDAQDAEGASSRARCSTIKAQAFHGTFSIRMSGATR